VTIEEVLAVDAEARDVATRLSGKYRI